MDTSSSQVTLDVVYQGRVISLLPGVAESDDELYYRMMHSLVISPDPVRVGAIDTLSTYGMQFSQVRGYQPHLSNTMIMRKVVQESIFRQAIIRYIQNYVDADDASILRMIGRNNNDVIVAKHLSQMPRKIRRGFDQRSHDRINTVSNLLSRVPHTPIVNYLDYGTGDGKIAATLTDILSTPQGRRINVQGVDVYPMERPIPTHIIRDGDNLPDEWTDRFQLITAFVVMHHVKNQEQTLRELHRVLSPGGLLILREHDYRDLTPSSLLRMQKKHMSGPQGVVLDVDIQDDMFRERSYAIGGDPFRHFLDAVHIVSMAFSDEDTHGFWSLYRSRMEWQSMLQNAGFSHVCSFAQGFSSVSSQMESRGSVCHVTRQKPQIGTSPDDTDSLDDDCNTWLSRNPQRIYESVHMKPIPIEMRESIPLILEYKAQREVALDTFFPRKGGREGEVPLTHPGIHYDEEILSYMTPWFAAQQTSVLISQLIRKEYGEEYTPRPTAIDPNPVPRRKTPQFRLFDGTGGAGGNMIAFMFNRDISSIYMYERVAKFYNFVVNNAELYSGQKAQPISRRDRSAVVLTHTPAKEQSVYIYNREFPLKDLTANIRGNRGDARTQMSGSVLFLDVPWVAEGCGYKLHSYMYAGETLESIASIVLNAGAYMVVYKLPPGYQLGVKHIVKELGKETLYIVFRRFIRRPVRSIQRPLVIVRNRPTVIHTTQNIQGGNPAYELLRYRLMDYLRAQFRSLVPNTKKDDYYMWIYERIRTYGLCTGVQNVCVLDPIIPATPTLVSSNMIAIEPYWPDVPFTVLADLIREQYPQLIDQLSHTFFFDDQSVLALRRAVARETSIRDGSRVQDVMTELDTLARTLYDVFTQYSTIEGIDATVNVIQPTRGRGNNISCVITPNQTLANILLDLDRQFGYTCRYPSCATQSQAFACVSVTNTKLINLKEGYKGTTFEQDLGAMLLRYTIMMEPTREMSFSGVNLHAAIPLTVFSVLEEKLKVTTECFASPLNATLASFMSAFPDVDAPFGSVGSFFTYDFMRGGSYEANPPFTEDMIDAMMIHMEDLLRRADIQEIPLSFFVVVPNWQSPPVQRIRDSPWKRFDMIISASQHRFVGGQQHIQEGSFVATFDTYIAVLQSQAGTVQYSIPSEFGARVITSFT